MSSCDTRSKDRSPSSRHALGAYWRVLCLPKGMGFVLKPVDSSCVYYVNDLILFHTTKANEIRV
jgi:hypothetical protein